MRIALKLTSCRFMIQEIFRERKRYVDVVVLAY